MLLQGAIELANVERWVLEHGESPPPVGLQGLLKKHAYEVSVVDRFHRLARRDFDRKGYVSIWERPLTTGAKGRPKTIDVSLFDTATQEEVRVELGLYKKKELREDAKKLHAEKGNPYLAGYTVDRNVLALWALREEKTTAEVANDWMATFKADAAAVSNANLTVTALLASTLDLFVAEPGGHRYAVVGLFDVA